MSEIIHVTDDSFDQDVLNAGLPVLVDFWAPWCGPCKMIAPVLDVLAGDYGSKLIIAKLNIDQNQAVPALFSVRSIPTLLLFKNGELAASKVGAASESQLKAFLDANL